MVLIDVRCHQRGSNVGSGRREFGGRWKEAETGGMCTRLPVRRPNCCVPAGTGEFFLARSLSILLFFCLRRSFLEPPPAATGDLHRQLQGRQKSRFARREWERGERRADCRQRDEFFPAYQTSQFTQSGMVMGVKGGPWGGPRFINTVVSSDRVRTSNASVNIVDLCGERKSFYHPRRRDVFFHPL